jgi:hypothetical protein
MAFIESNCGAQIGRDARAEAGSVKDESSHVERSLEYPLAKRIFQSQAAGHD